MPITYTCDCCNNACTPVGGLDKRIEHNGETFWVSVRIQPPIGATDEVCCKACMVAKLDGLPALTGMGW